MAQSTDPAHAGGVARDSKRLPSNRPLLRNRANVAIRHETDTGSVTPGSEYTVSQLIGYARHPAKSSEKAKVQPNVCLVLPATPRNTMDRGHDGDVTYARGEKTDYVSMVDVRMHNVGMDGV